MLLLLLFRPNSHHPSHSLFQPPYGSFISHPIRDTPRHDSNVHYLIQVTVFVPSGDKQWNPTQSQATMGSTIQRAFQETGETIEQKGHLICMLPIQVQPHRSPSYGPPSPIKRGLQALSGVVPKIMKRAFKFHCSSYTIYIKTP